MKWLALKLVNFGIWIYDINTDEVWDKTDQEIYEKLNSYKRKLEAPRDVKP